MKLFEDHPGIVLAAMMFVVYGMLLDMFTTMYCEAYIPGCFEANPLLVDSLGKYLPLKFWTANAIMILGTWLPLAGLLAIAFRKWAIASIPFWYLGAIFVEQGTKNLLLIIFG